MLNIISPDNTLRVTEIRLNAEVVRFNTTSLHKTYAAHPANPQSARLLGPMNGYLEQMPPNAQAELFEIYRRIRETFDTVYNHLRLASTVRELIAKLVDALDMPSYLKWLHIHSPATYPAGVEDQFVESKGPRELTYIRSEYRDLVYLGYVLKALLPVIGEYITITRDIVGNSMKEYYALGLLPPSITESPAYCRWRRYVEADVQYFKNINSATHGGLGAEDLPDWLMGLSIYRRIMMFDMMERDGHLIKWVYSYLKNRMDIRDPSFERHKDREFQSSGTDEDNISILESSGFIESGDPTFAVLVEAYLINNYRHMAKTLDPKICMQTVDRHIAFYRDQRITSIPIHKYIVSPIVEPFMPAKVMDEIDYTAYPILIGLCHAYLNHIGCHTLAKYCSMRYEVLGEDISMDTRGMSRITKATITSLCERYPYVIRGGRPELTPKDNPAAIAVESIAEYIRDHEIIERDPLAGDHAPRTRHIPSIDIRKHMSEEFLLLIETLSPLVIPDPSQPQKGK